MAPNRGWLFVLIGVLISSFLGGAIRVLFSPERVTEFVESLLEQNQPKFSITFSSARLRMADGLRPILAVELNNLVIKAKNPCVTNSVIEADHMVVPLQILPFLGRKVLFGDIHAERVKWLWRDATCESPEAAHEDALVDEIAPLERFFQQRWSIEVVRTANYLEALTVDRLEIVKGSEEWFRVEDFEMNFEGDKKRSNLSGRFYLGTKWLGPVDVAAFDFIGRVNADSLDLKAHSHVKEGQLSFGADWHVNTGQLTVDTNMTDVPVQSALALARHWGAFAAFEPKLKDEWMTCALQYKGDIRSVAKLPININGCKLYGDLGRWEVRTSSIKLEQPLPVTLSMVDVDVLGWLQSFGWASTWGVVSQFGRFSGDFILQAPNDFSLRGQLHDLEVYLVSSRDRIKQRIKAATLDLKFSNDQFTGEAKRITIDNGEVQGGLSLAMNLSGEGHFHLDFSKIILASPVQRVVWGGLVPEASLVGDGNMLATELVKFNGHVKLSGLETHYWEMQNIASAVQFENHSWSFQPTAERFAVRPESKWLRMVNTIGAPIEPHPREIVFRHLSAESIWTDGTGRWQKFRASVPDSKTFIVSEGEWDSKMHLTGSVSADYNKNSHLTWGLTGNFVEPQLEVQ